MEERLDRFCATTEWSLLFPEAKVVHIDSDSLDHLPILLQCYPAYISGKRHKAKFNFENMWVTDTSYTDVISNAWKQDERRDVVENLLVKVDRCSHELKLSNKNSFIHVGDEILKLETSLESIRDDGMRREALSKIRE